MDFTYLFFVVLSFVQCYNAQLSSFFLPPPLTSGAVNTPWLGQQGQWQTPNQGAPDTVPAIPANSAVNSVGQWVSSGGQGTPNTMSAIHANSAFTRGGQGNVLMTEPWAPGESRRVFSRDPQIWFNSCQRT